MAEATAPSLIPVAIEDEMRQAYLDYSMSVIVGRALPDVRDGLKPVHRRILYAMFEQGMLHNRRYSKCAGTVGEVLKRYHPHGDAAVYDALVRLAQEWNLRAPLIDGQGNFGSIDGDSAAAYRYTEARLTKLAEAMLADIDKETVDFTPNFDDSTTEPSVLPTRFPNLLVNGSAGIAVGMATNVPPHNLGETIRSCIHLIDHPDAPLRDLLDPKLGGTLPGGIQGPDLPTGGIIMGVAPIRALYETGRGILRMRAKVEIETDKKTGRDTIVVTEVPYQVNKARAIQTIAEMVKEKKLEGISDLRDESSREGIRAVVETKRDAVTGVVLNNLYQHSALFQDTFGATLLAIDRGQPRTLGVKPLLERFIAHRRDVVTRRTRYDLREARDLSDEDLIADEDMVVTVSHTGYVKRNPVSLYRAQKRGGKGKTGAMTSDDDFIEQIFVASTHAYLLLFTNKGRVFWLKVHELPQAGRAARGKAIINLVPLGAEEKLAALLTVKELPKKLAAEGEEAEGEEAAAEAETPAPGDAEQTEGARDEARAAAEDAIAVSKGPYIVFVTRNGLIKRTALSAFSRPRPSGLKALSIEENDSLVSVMHARGNEDVVIGTADGMAIRFEQKEVRSMGRTAYGVKGITLEDGDHVVGAELVHSGSTLLTVTENGYGKRTTIDEYRRTHRGGKGIIDIKTSERNGKVVAMQQVTDADEVMIVTNKGMIIRTRAAEVSLIGRNTQGVRLIDLRQEGEKVVGATRAPEEREAEAAAEVAAENAAAGLEDDDGSPPDGSEDT